MMDGEHIFTATRGMRLATFLQAIEWIDKAWAPVTAKIILSGFRKAGVNGTGTDPDLDDSHTEEEVPICLPWELAELFGSDTEDEEFNGFSDLE